MGRSLIATVHVRGQAYGPGSHVPDKVAAQITNPAAWGPEDAQEAPRGSGSAPAPSNAGARGAERAETGDSVDPRAELEPLTKADLVALAEARGVESRGSKADLVDRLSKS